MREPGYYWVCIDKRDLDEWVVAFWSGQFWHFIDQEPSYIADTDLPEIDERRIVRVSTIEEIKTTDPVTIALQKLIDRDEPDRFFE